MFRKVLVCSDVSPASDALTQCLAQMKGIGLEEVVLTHVVFVANIPGLEERLASDARPVLERQKHILEEHGIRVTVEMPVGLTAPTLAETARRHDVSAIIIGSHDRGALGAAGFASVSGKLLHQTQRPVLLARDVVLAGGGREAACRKMFARVLFPTDFSESAEKAIGYVGRIAAGAGSRVTVMHVLPPKEGEPGDREREDGARFLLEEKKLRLQRLGIANVSSELVVGDPSHEILARASQGEFSVIVMGGHDKGLFRELFYGSVTNAVVHKAGVPVLVIPAAVTAE